MSNHIDDIEELDLPVDLPPVQPESLCYEEDNIRDYGECSDDGENIGDVILTVSENYNQNKLNEDTNIDFTVLDLHYIFPHEYISL